MIFLSESNINPVSLFRSYPKDFLSNFERIDLRGNKGRADDVVLVHMRGE
jgi:hypothetical protein